MNTLTTSSTLDRVKQHLVDLKMSSALEVLDGLLRRVERDELSTLEALESLLAEENTIRETRRIRAQLMTFQAHEHQDLGIVRFQFPALVGP